MSPRKTLWGAAAFVACTILCTATLPAIEPSVSPSSGGIGQEIVLHSFFFTPVKKPRVRLSPHPEQTAVKYVSAKVTEFGAEEIDATVTKGAAGVYDVIVMPRDRGVEGAVLNTFTILLPVVDSTEPTSGAGGTEVTIHGSLFGPSKGKVTIGGKKAKVKTWSDDTIVVVVSKKAPVGDQPVVVINKAGASTAELTFSVAESPSGGGGGGGGGNSDLYFRADLSGIGQFDLTNPAAEAFGAAWDQIVGQLMLQGTTDTFDGLPSLGLTVSGLVPERPFPFVVGLEPMPPDLSMAFLQYADGSAFYVAALGTPGSALTVTVESWDGTILTGTFSGTLIDVQGTAPPITVTNGEFRVRVVAGQ